jgi:hypothetical protein
MMRDIDGLQGRSLARPDQIRSVSPPGEYAQTVTHLCGVTAATSQADPFHPTERLPQERIDDCAIPD